MAPNPTRPLGSFLILKGPAHHVSTDLDPAFDQDRSRRTRRRCKTADMRIPAKVDYAIRALAELASAGGGPVKAERLAESQDIPLKFLQGILTELRRARLVTSHRGPEGGFMLGRPATEIALADIFRAIDGPLAEVRDQRLSSMDYEGAAKDLPVVWMAVRAGLRRVLEVVSIADLASSTLPQSVTDLADEYDTVTKQRHPAAAG
jgi:Rrf2 family protein